MTKYLYMPLLYSKYTLNVAKCTHTITQIYTFQNNNSCLQLSARHFVTTLYTNIYFSKQQFVFTTLCTTFQFTSFGRFRASFQIAGHNLYFGHQENKSGHSFCHFGHIPVLLLLLPCLRFRSFWPPGFGLILTYKFRSQYVCLFWPNVLSGGQHNCPNDITWPNFF